MTKFNIRNLFLYIIFIFIIGMFVILYILVEGKNTQVELFKNQLIKEAELLFNNMVILRKWNAIHGFIYVKDNGTMSPNKYLENNTVKSDKGDTLIRINPAWMTRQFSEISNKYASYYYKVTSLNLKNPDNKADKFETEALKYLELNKEEKYYYKINNKNQRFDFVGSLKVEKECISCHKDEKLDDIRGGIRVSIPLDTYNLNIENIKNHTFIISIFILLFGLLTLISSLFLINIIFKRQEEEKKLSKENILLNQQVKDAINQNREKDHLLYIQSRSAQMGEMVSMIAHQWRQPLNSISAAAIKLELKQELEELNNQDIKEVSRFIQAQSQDMSAIINDFMNFFKSESNKSLFLVESTIEDIRKIVLPQFKSRNIICKEKIEAGLTLFGHKKELVHILLNILTNSRDAFSEKSQNFNEITVDAKKIDNNVIIRICDNAGGIDESIIERVFDPYFTTKKQGKGTGIGLYMVKEMLSNDFSGTISVENFDSKGVCFTIVIPIQ